MLTATGNRRDSLLLGAMVVFIFLSVVLTALTLTELGRSRSFHFVLGVCALATTLICLAEARRYRPPPAGSKMSWRFEDLDLANLALWGLVATISFFESAGVSLLRPEWQ